MSPEKRTRFLRNVAQDTDRLQGLTDRLLEMARADVIAPTGETTELTPVLGICAERYKHQNVEISLHPVSNRARAAIASEILETVLTNLLDNSRQNGADSRGYRSESSRRICSTSSSPTTAPGSLRLTLNIYLSLSLRPAETKAARGWVWESSGRCSKPTTAKFRWSPARPERLFASRFPKRPVDRLQVKSEQNRRTLILWPCLCSNLFYLNETASKQAGVEVTFFNPSTLGPGVQTTCPQKFTQQFKADVGSRIGPRLCPSALRAETSSVIGRPLRKFMILVVTNRV